MVKYAPFLLDKDNIFIVNSVQFRKFITIISLILIALGFVKELYCYFLI